MSEQKTTDYEYDALGRLTVVREKHHGPNGQVTTKVTVTKYDHLGNTARVTETTLVLPAPPYPSVVVASNSMSADDLARAIRRALDDEGLTS